MEEKFEWLNEQIPKLRHGNWLYKIMCLLLFKRKLTYQDYYIIIWQINKGKLGDKKAKHYSIKRVIQLYKDLHNGEKPKGL